MTTYDEMINAAMVYTAENLRQMTMYSDQQVQALRYMTEKEKLDSLNRTRVEKWRETRSTMMRLGWLDDGVQVRRIK